MFFEDYFYFFLAMFVNPQFSATLKWDSKILVVIERKKPITDENKEALKLYKEGKNKQRQGV